MTNEEAWNQLRRVRRLASLTRWMLQEGGGACPCWSEPALPEEFISVLAQPEEHLLALQIWVPLQEDDKWIRSVRGGQELPFQARWH